MCMSVCVTVSIPQTSLTLDEVHNRKLNLVMYFQKQALNKLYETQQIKRSHTSVNEQKLILYVKKAKFLNLFIFSDSST